MKAHMLRGHGAEAAAEGSVSPAVLGPGSQASKDYA
jgi:hypothetical protein